MTVTVIAMPAVALLGADDKLRCCSSTHGDGVASPFDSAGGDVGNGDRLVAVRIERGIEFTHTASECGVARQCSQTVSAAELQGAGITCGRVAEGVLSGDGEIGWKELSAGRDAVGRVTDDKKGRRAGDDRDRAGGAVDARSRGVRGRQLLVACCLEHHAINADAAG